MGDLHLERGQLNRLVRIVRGKVPLSTRADPRLDLDDLGGLQRHLTMPWVPGLGTRSALRASVGCPLLIPADRRRGDDRSCGSSGTGELRCGAPPFLLLDNSKQLQDQLAHDKWGLFPTGDIQRNSGWQWARSCYLTAHIIPLEVL